MMEGFAAWLAKLMAAGAALLAAVWIWQGWPLQGDALEDAIARCLREADRVLPGLNNPLIPSWMVNPARREGCILGTRAAQDALMMRGLLAAGAAVVLLCLGVMVGRRAEAAKAPQAEAEPPRLPWPELDARATALQAEHKRLTGAEMPRQTALERIRWQHRNGR